MSPLVPYEHLSKAERVLTPVRLCNYLIDTVRFRLGEPSILWISPNSNYRALIADSQLWDIYRDARTYTGPGPIIAHPPCGPWGKYQHNSFDTHDHGIKAMEFVHTYGGVVEQPLGSSLFKEFGRVGAVISGINQGDWITDNERLSTKATLLYWWPATEFLDQCLL